jgi:hypothetical protein
MIKENLKKEDPSLRRTIGVNYTRGYHFNLSQTQHRKTTTDKKLENAEESKDHRFR